MLRYLPPAEQRRLDAAFRRVWRDDARRQQGGYCAYCEEPLNCRTATADHEKARAVGGLDERNNIVAACAPCNRLKGHMPPALFRRMVRDPKPGEPIRFRLAWSRWRVNSRLRLMERRLALATGRLVR